MLLVPGTKQLTPPCLRIEQSNLNGTTRLTSTTVDIVDTIYVIALNEIGHWKCVVETVKSAVSKKVWPGVRPGVWPGRWRRMRNALGRKFTLVGK